MNAGGAGPTRRNSRVAAINNRSSVALDQPQKGSQTTKFKSSFVLDEIAE